MPRAGGALWQALPRPYLHAALAEVHLPLALRRARLRGGRCPAQRPSSERRCGTPAASGRKGESLSTGFQHRAAPLRALHPTTTTAGPVPGPAAQRQPPAAPQRPRRRHLASSSSRPPRAPPAISAAGPPWRPAGRKGGGGGNGGREGRTAPPCQPPVALRHGCPAAGDGELPCRGRFDVAVSARSRGWEEAEPLVPVLEVKAFCFRKRQSSPKKNKLANNAALLHTACLRWD